MVRAHFAEHARLMLISGTAFSPMRGVAMAMHNRAGGAQLNGVPGRKEAKWRHERARSAAAELGLPDCPGTNGRKVLGRGRRSGAPSLEGSLSSRRRRHAPELCRLGQSPPPTTDLNQCKGERWHQLTTLVAGNACLSRGMELLRQ
jgi:hypothetical protein